MIRRRIREIKKKFCSSCMNNKPIGEFYSTHGGYTSSCKLCFFKTPSTIAKANTTEELLYRCSIKYSVSANELKLCKAENSYRPKSHFSRDLISDDGYTQSCSECLYNIPHTESDIQKQILIERMSGLVNIDDAFLFPMPMDEFLSLRLIKRYTGNCILSEKDIRENSLSIIPAPRENDSYLPLFSGEDLPFDEYCHHEPPSSFRDFLISESGPAEDRMRAILENLGELACATRAMRKTACIYY